MPRIRSFRFLAFLSTFLPSRTPAWQLTSAAQLDCSRRGHGLEFSSPQDGVLEGPLNLSLIAHVLLSMNYTGFISKVTSTKTSCCSPTNETLHCISISTSLCAGSRLVWRRRDRNQTLRRKSTHKSLIMIQSVWIQRPIWNSCSPTREKPMASYTRCALKLPSHTPSHMMR